MEDARANGPERPWLILNVRRKRATPMLLSGILMTLVGTLLAYTCVAGFRSEQLVLGKWQHRTIKKKEQPIRYWLWLSLGFILMVAWFGAAIHQFSKAIS